MLRKKKISFKSKKSSEDVTWVLDGIVGFLQSPTWTVPIMNFVEENCSCFEAKEENKFEYTDIHIKYKNLVEELLFKYIKELNISEELFAEACNKHKSSIDHVEGVFEYVWAADEFLVFKRLMARHNLELDMQAISMVQMQNKQQTLDPHPFTSVAEPDPETKVDFILAKSKKEFAEASSLLKRLQAEEDYNLQRAIEFSKQENERLNKLAQLEKDMLERAIQLSLESVKTDQRNKVAAAVPPSAQHSIVEESPGAGTSSRQEQDFPFSPSLAQPSAYNSQAQSSQKEETSIPKTAAASSSSEKAPKAKVKQQKMNQQQTSPSHHTTLAPIKQHKTNSEIAAEWISMARQESSGGDGSTMTSENHHGHHAMSSSGSSGIDPEELEKRKEYLKRQREKILEAKRQQRDRELESHQEVNKHAKGDGGGGNSDESERAAEMEKEKMLKARRALAERLKREVVSKKK